MERYPVGQNHDGRQRKPDRERADRSAGRGGKCAGRRGERAHMQRVDGRKGILAIAGEGDARTCPSPSCDRDECGWTGASFRAAAPIQVAFEQTSTAIRRIDLAMPRNKFIRVPTLLDDGSFHFFPASRNKRSSEQLNLGGHRPPFEYGACRG